MLYPQNHASLVELVVPVLPAIMALSVPADTPVPDVTTVFSISVIIRQLLESYILLPLVELSTIVLLEESTIFITHVAFLYIPSLAIAAYAPAISSVVTPYVNPPNAVAIWSLSIHTFLKSILVRNDTPERGDILCNIFHATVFFEVLTASLKVISPAYTPSALTGPPSMLSSVTMESGLFPICRYGIYTINGLIALPGCLAL